MPIPKYVIVVDEDELAEYRYADTLHVFDSLEQARNTLVNSTFRYSDCSCWVFDSMWTALDHFNSIDDLLDAIGEDNYPTPENNTIDEQPFDLYTVIDDAGEVMNSGTYNREFIAMDVAERCATESPTVPFTIYGMTALRTCTAKITWKEV